MSWKKTERFYNEKKKTSVISYFPMTIDLFSERTREEPLGIFPAAEKFASISNSFKGQILQSTELSIHNILTAKPAEKV